MTDDLVRDDLAHPNAEPPDLGLEAPDDDPDVAYPDGAPTHTAAEPAVAHKDPDTGEHNPVGKIVAVYGIGRLTLRDPNPDDATRGGGELLPDKPLVKDVEAWIEEALAAHGYAARAELVDTTN